MNFKSQLDNGRLGFTLPEVSMAVAIVSFTLLPMIGILGLVSTNEREIKDDEVLFKFVDNLSQTLRQESRSPLQFIWSFPDQENSPVVIDYPQSDSEEITVYLVGDERGRIVRSVSEAVFNAGDPEAPLDELYLIKVTMRADSSGTISQMVDGFALLLDVAIESPINVAEPNRSKQLYTSRIF